MQGSLPEDVEVRSVAGWVRKPSEPLQPFVQEYAFRDDRLLGAEIYRPLPARTDCFLQFYLRDPYKVVDIAACTTHLAPHSVLVGPHVRRREDLIWTGHLKVFTIRFTGGGFRPLFGIPAEAIRGYAGAANFVLGRRADELAERLAESPESRLTATADHYLNRLMASADRSLGTRATSMAAALRRSKGRLGVGALADSFGTSARQVERIFQEQIGVSPKTFARLVRLERALALSNLDTVNWTEIASAAGYFDQSHMIREFQDLNGTTPTQFRELGRRAAQFRNLSDRGRDVAFVLSNLD